MYILGLGCAGASGRLYERQYVLAHFGMGMLAGFVYSTSHINTRRLKLRNLWIRRFWTVEPGVGIPSKSQIRLLEKMFILLDFRPEQQICVTTISTIPCIRITQSHFQLPRGGGAKKNPGGLRITFTFEIQTVYRSMTWFTQLPPAGGR